MPLHAEQVRQKLITLCHSRYSLFIPFFFSFFFNGGGLDFLHAFAMGHKFSKRRSSVDERFTKPQGLYQHKDVDHKKLRRLILGAKLAPCYPGADDPSIDLEECPICFLFYPSLNRSKCCLKEICTECFLQMKSPHSVQPTQCPFCKTPNYAVEYRGAKTMEEKGIEQAEEQKVIEAKIRIRQKEMEDEENHLQREEGNVQEMSILTATHSLRHKFLNLHGFKIPSKIPEVDIALRNPEDSHDTPVIVLDVIDDERNSGPEASRENSSAGLSRDIVGHRLMHEPHGGSATYSQGSRVTCSSFARLNRDEEFDLDLEDIMVMEAIWLSIQEQGVSNSQNMHSLSSSGPSGGGHVSEHSSHTAAVVQASNVRHGLPGVNAVTSGLAGAIAALAERQMLGMNDDGVWHCNENCQMDIHGNNAIMLQSDTRISQELQVSTSSQGLDGSGASSCPTLARSQNIDENLHPQAIISLDYEEETEVDVIASTCLQEHQNTSERQETSQESNSWIEVSLESGKALSPHALGETSEFVPNHNSETVRSISSSLPSISDVSSEVPDVPEGKNCEGIVDAQSLQAYAAVLPESFEERMMLAMALSLAEAQSQ